MRTCVITEVNDQKKAEEQDDESSGSSEEESETESETTSSVSNQLKTMAPSHTTERLNKSKQNANSARNSMNIETDAIDTS